MRTLPQSLVWWQAVCKAVKVSAENWAEHEHVYSDAPEQTEWPGNGTDDEVVADVVNECGHLYAGTWPVSGDRLHEDTQKWLVKRFRSAYHKERLRLQGRK